MMSISGICQVVSSSEPGRRITRPCTKDTVALPALLAVLFALGTAQAQTCFNWAETSLTDPLPRIRHSMSYDSDQGLVVLFGGTETSDTWLWNGVSWTELQAVSPPSRISAGMAYDEQHAVTVLFGGFGVSAIGFRQDTWTFSGGTWVEVNTQEDAVAPSPRQQHALAYDRVRNVTVLFGGLTGILGPSMGDTWEWDGTTWTLVATTDPAARHDHAMVFDRERNVTVLFGGNSTLGGSGLSDTWEWNGSTWTEVSTTGPSARYRHAMTFDESRNKTVLFGGKNGDRQVLNDTWDWDGTTWYPRALKASPPAREWHAMAFDTARGEAVMFGGQLITTLWSSTWTFAAGPPMISQQPVNAAGVTGFSVGFGVTALGTGPISYQWRKDELPIENATGAFLSMASADEVDAGSYDVVVTGPCDAVTSEAVTLEVFFAPDLNADGRIDLLDFAIFQTMLSGP